MSVHPTHASMVTVLMLSMVTYVDVSQDMKEHIVMLVGVIYNICTWWVKTRLKKSSENINDVNGKKVLMYMSC